MGKPHALVVPFPAQGHVLPLMELSHRLVDRGVGITMVCSDFDKARMEASLHSKELDNPKSLEGISFVAVPDGLEADDDRGDVGNLCKFVLGLNFERFLEHLMRTINEREEDQLSCVIADVCAMAAFSVAKKMGIPSFGFSPSSVANLALSLEFPKLIESGILDVNTGEVQENLIFQLSPAMPEMSTSWLALNSLSGSSRRFVLQLTLEVCRVVALLDRILCNTFREIEAPALDILPQAVPIGPLLPTTHTKSVGHFWEEDSSCLTWLDQQQHSSVIYIAFGSLAVLYQTQFEELAAGLEHTGRPFLWVVRPNLMSGSTVVYPENYLERVGERGKIVNWAPQQKVLAHPAVACFISHCGWNSTLEGLTHGVPFLCWPYLGDQFLDKNYICQVWKIGLELKAEENGIITRGEIQKKTQLLLCDQEGMKTRALKMKEMAEEAVGSGGTSRKNFDDFIEEIKGDNH